MLLLTKPQRALAFAAACVITLSLLSGCAQIRKVTYPPDFVYLTDKDVSSGMQRIASHLVSIELALGDDSSAQDTAGIVRSHLDGMRQVAMELGADASATNHLLLDAHMDDFLAALETARAGTTAVPPRFFEAGKLVGSCSSCHRFH